MKIRVEAVINPLTGRKIAIGSKIHQRLVKKGIITTENTRKTTKQLTEANIPQSTIEMSRVKARSIWNVISIKGR